MKLTLIRTAIVFCLLCAFTTTILWLAHSKSIPQYYVTAITDNFYDRLIGLIGSIHKTNFDTLEEISVYDLGISQAHKDELMRMQKVKVYSVEMVHPDLLKPFKVDTHRSVPGWYAWKPVIMKQSLDKFPYVLWIDAGTTVLKPLDSLFEYIKDNGYFFLDLGDDKVPVKHNIKWQTTRYLIEKFDLESSENRWILDDDTFGIDAGIIGVSRKVYDTIVLPMYEEAKTLRSYVDDGTTPTGFGSGRHDQALFNIYIRLLGYTIIEQDYRQEHPGLLEIANKQYPLFVTWNRTFVGPQTNIYRSRADVNPNYYKQFIHWKPSNP